MKKLLFIFATILAIGMNVHAADLNTLNWGQVCAGNMGASWYSSAEAQAIADIVLDVQKSNGGWMKNDQLHKLTPAELATLKAEKSLHSCLDNAATTMEMRFLAKVYQGTKVEKYREAFVKGLNMIFDAEKGCGGWSQYWPLSGNGSYQDYITFNDDLITNVMKLLRDINSNQGDFADIVDESTRERCMASFNKALDVILKCQIDDNGTKAAWCAQHDTTDFLPTEGRPHEFPSVSGYESASLLSFLMTIDHPSKELQQAIISAVEWLDAHKIEGKAIEDYTNDKGERDRRIVDKEGSAIWGRFIQIGGASGTAIYNKFFTKLKERGKDRSHYYNGKNYTYSEYEIATVSYNPDKAYQPIFGIYDNDNAHLFYRFLYNYEDSDPIIDDKGLPIATSLRSDNRANYQYLGSWCMNTINVEYPAWKQKIDAQNQTGETILYTLSAETYTGSETSNNRITYNFSDGFSVTNTANKGYGAGKANTVKYSATNYDITIPEGMKVVKATLYGYDNYDVDAYIRSFNGKTYSPTDYVFPAKIDGNMNFTTHTFDLSDNPATGTLSLSIGSKQCCLIISLYGMPVSNSIRTHSVETCPTAKYVEDGKVVIVRNQQKYNISGQQVQ